MINIIKRMNLINNNINHKKKVNHQLHNKENKIEKNFYFKENQEKLNLLQVGNQLLKNIQLKINNLSNKNKKIN